MKNILPCPFCGESEALHVLEIDRQDFRKDVNDRVSRIGKLVYAVECQNCSASGPTGIDFDIRHEIQEEDVMRLKNEAIFEWNARSSIRDKSFEFVNSVLKKLTDANEKIIGDACNHDNLFFERNYQ